MMLRSSYQLDSVDDDVKKEDYDDEDGDNDDVEDEHVNNGDADEITDNDVMPVVIWLQWKKPGEQDIDLDVGGEDDDEGQEEDLGVVQRVVDVRPVRGAAAKI